MSANLQAVSNLGPVAGNRAATANPYLPHLAVLDRVVDEIREVKTFHWHFEDPARQAAFQGFRPPILDAVVFASTRIGRLDASATEPDTDAAEFLAKCRRLLVSEAQNAIDPRRRGQMLRRLAVGRLDDKTSAYALSAELGEALESLYPGYLLQRRDAAWIANREAIARQRT